MTDDNKLKLEKLLYGKASLRVIGDVQGQADEFDVAVKEARSLNMAVLCLGDITDRGPDSAGSIRTMLDLLDTGDGMFIGGNHDSKFMRWAMGNNVSVTNKDLLTTIQNLSDAPDGIDLKERFAVACAEAPTWLHTGREFFVHGAFSYEMIQYIEGPSLRENSGRIFGSMAFTALYAETDGTFGADGKPTRTHNWVNKVPAGMTVYVGHDTLSTKQITEKKSALGGTTFFVDTGAGGPGGKLSWIDIPAQRLLDNIKTAKRVLSFNTMPASTKKPLVPEKQGEVMLTLMVGPSGAGKSTWAQANFPKDSIVSLEDIHFELQKNANIPTKDYRGTMNIAVARVAAILATGQPAVLDSANLNIKQRKQFIALAPKGTNVRYVVMERPVEKKQLHWQAKGTDLDFIAKQQEEFEKKFSSIIRGDQIDNVVVKDMRDPISVLRYENTVKSKKKNDKCL